MLLVNAREKKKKFPVASAVLTAEENELVKCLAISKISKKIKIYMENKSNANSIWTERLKINSLKKKWISLMSQSKINEIEKLLAGANNALKVRFIKLESEKSLSDIPRINSDEMIQLPCNKSILHDKSYKKNNKNLFSSNRK